MGEVFGDEGFGLGAGTEEVLKCQLESHMSQGKVLTYLKMGLELRFGCVGLQVGDDELRNRVLVYADESVSSCSSPFMAS